MVNPLENVVRHMKYNHVHSKRDINATILSGGSDPLIEQNLQTESKVNATRPSARGHAPIKQDHLHTEGREMPQDHQQEVLHLSNRITYIPRAGECHKTISKRSCIYQTGSLTY